MRGADHAGHRARLHHRHRLAPRLGDRHGAAVRAHDGDLARELRLAGEALEAREIAADARPHEGVERGRRGPLVFAKLAQDFVAGGDEDVRADAAQHLAGHDLVGRVGIGVQEADRHRLDAQRGEPVPERLDGGVVDRHQHVARRVHPLAHLEGEIARHQRPRPVEVEIERVGPVAAPERVDVAKAFRGDERRGGPAALQHGVDGDGRAVQQFADRRHVASGVAQRRRGPDGRVGRNRQRLGGDDDAVGKADEIGEGAADVDADHAHDMRALIRTAPGRTCRCRAPWRRERWAGCPVP